MKYLAVLGRLPQLSLAELVSLYGDKVKFLNFELATIEAEKVDFNRLGGTLKLAQVEAEFPHLNLEEALKKLFDQELLDRLVPPSEQKLTVGISAYFKHVPSRELFRTGLELKKKLRQRGQSVRVIEPKGSHLNTAQVLHNHMTTNGAEIIVADGQNQTLVARTLAVQDIDAYRKRDYERPARSAKVGMLPPKLAQMMINLADPAPDSMVLDPFCGTGVVLQEAALMGFKAYGSDLESDLIEMSGKNLEHLGLTAQLEVGDATTHTWTGPVGAVVTEGYLGPALEKEPSPEELGKLQQDAADLTLAFLKNLRPQLEPGTPVCLSLPAWRQGKRYMEPQMIDQIEGLGYTSKSFFPALPADLLYYRPDQIVARKLIVLTSI